MASRRFNYTDVSKKIPASIFKEVPEYLITNQHYCERLSYRIFLPLWRAYLLSVNYHENGGNRCLLNLCKYLRST